MSLVAGVVKRRYSTLSVSLWRLDSVMAVISCEYVEEEGVCHHCAGMVVVEIGEEAEREGLENVIAVGLGNTNWF